MHSPPCTTIGEAETRCSAIRPSSPIAHRRWTNTSYLMGSSWATGATTMGHSLSRGEDEVPIAVDRALIVRWDDDGGQRGLHDRWPQHQRARPQPVVVVDGGVHEAPVEVGRARALPRLAGVQAAALLLDQYRLGHLAHGVHAQAVDLHAGLGEASPLAVELLVLGLEEPPQLRHPRRVQARPGERKLHAVGLAAEAHRDEAAERDLLGAEVLAFHQR